MNQTQPHSQGRLWYVRRGEVVKGPFQTSLIQRYLILGRVQPTDEVSLDREAWQHPGGYPMFAPAQLAEMRERVLAREDERKPVDRRHGESPDNPYKERRSGAERRAEEPREAIERRKRRARVVESLKPARQSNLIPVVVSAAIVAIVVISGFLFKPDIGLSTPVCDALPAPEVNWSNCRNDGINAAGADMHGAILRNARLTAADFSGSKLNDSDLAYVELIGANLAGSDLSNAMMKGATLRKADLSGAKLDGADLSYADFSDAVIEGATFVGSKLDNAIWVDGRSCTPGSVETCQ